MNEHEFYNILMIDTDNHSQTEIMFPFVPQVEDYIMYDDVEFQVVKAGFNILGDYAIPVIYVEEV